MTTARAQRCRAGDEHARLPDQEYAAIVLSARVLRLVQAAGRARVARRRIAALTERGVHVVGVAPGADVTGPGLGHELAATELVPDWSTAFRHLADAGIGPGLILLVAAGREAVDPPPRSTLRTLADGDALDPLIAALDAVERRAAARRVGSVDLDPQWIIEEAGPAPRRRRVREALFAQVANGFGSRGSVEEEPPGAEPLVLAAGAYEGQGPEQHLLPGPTWTRMAVSPVPTADRLVLDLRTGVLLREETGAAGVPLRSLRLASCARPGVCLLRAEAGALRLRSEAAGWDACAPAAASADDEARDYLAVAVAERTYRHARGRTVERFVGLAHDSSRRAARAVARQRADAAAGRGFEQLLADQRAVWAQRWREVDVRIPHDPAAQLALRYALHQLWSHTSSAAELAVGARGLTGPGYSGHVFWDADVFVLPALTTIDPPSAAAMLRYRARRLDAAARAATRQGRAGARFPWESARSGEDVTPAEAVLAGQRIPVRTGTQEEHITADVAWAAQFHREWTGRRSTPEDPVSLLVLEAARYWASRCRVDGSGTAHIDGVIGPDEYHENVVDNAYTNVMARWNLRRGAAHLEAGGERPHPEAVAWRRIAGALVDGYDPATGRYEQFRGYFDLPDLTVADLGRPPLAADLLLGAEGVAATQIIKQPDVLMLHHLVPDEVAPGSLRPNLDYYLPRTAHGSSLSPAISASLLARAGRADEALELLRLALRLDLDDVTGTTAAGLHLATLGGVWQCVLFGFAGARVVNGCLEVTPSLPSAWPELELRFLALGARVRLRIDGRQIRLRSDRDLLVDVEQAGIRRVADGEQLCVERRVKT